MKKTLTGIYDAINNANNANLKAMEVKAQPFKRFVNHRGELIVCDTKRDLIAYNESVEMERLG